MKKQFLLTFGLMIMFVCKIQAQTFEIDGINYKVISGTTVEVIANNPIYSGDVTIPSNVTRNAINYSVTSIGQSAFQVCSGLTSVTIPNSVTSIGDAAFSYCIGLTSVIIPNSVTRIGSHVFFYCTGLTSVNIPSSVTSIGKLAFAYCYSLTSVTIPYSVTSIGEFAFAFCTSLTTITSEAITPSSLGTNVFFNVNKSIPLYVPSGSVALYNAADQWKDFNVQPIIITNTNNLSANSNFKIYPNPASSIVTLVTTDLSTSSNFQLFDNSGKLVLSEQISGTTQLSIESLKSGIYLYQVTQNGNITTGKLIVK